MSSPRRFPNDFDCGRTRKCKFTAIASKLHISLFLCLFFCFFILFLSLFPPSLTFSLFLLFADYSSITAKILRAERYENKLLSLPPEKLILFVTRARFQRGLCSIPSTRVNANKIYPDKTGYRIYYRHELRTSRRDTRLTVHSSNIEENTSCKR